MTTPKKYASVCALIGLSFFIYINTNSRNTAALSSIYNNEKIAYSTKQKIESLNEEANFNRSSKMKADIEKRDRVGLPSLLERGLDYRQHRSDVNFDEKQFMKKLLMTEKTLFNSISQEFKDIDMLSREIAQEEFYFNTKPRSLIARMGLIDLLKSYCDKEIDELSADQSKQVFLDIIDYSIPRNLPEHIKRILVSEKYDALSSLAQCDPKQAFSAYRSLNNPILKNILLAALRDGLSKSVPSDKLEEVREELQKYTVTSNKESQI